MGENAEPTRDGLREALDGLVQQQTLSPEQAGAVLAAVAAGPRPASGPAAPGRGSWVPLLAEVGGYVGGLFVFAAAAVVTGPQWDRFGTAAKLAILGVPAAVLLLAAVAIAVAGSRRGARGRLVAALVLLAGALLGGVTAVLVEGDAQPTLVALTALVVWALGYLACGTALLHVGMALAAAWAVGLAEGWWFDDTSGVQWAGWLLVLLALVWFGLSELRVLREQVLGRVTAAVIAFCGSEAVVIDLDGGAQQAAGYVVLAAVAAACFAGYLAQRETAVLAAGVVTLAVLVPQCVIDYTDGALGAGGALLVTGLSIVGASVLGLRVRREALVGAV